MDLLRKLEWSSMKEWQNPKPLTPELERAQDCDVSLLNGWADRDLSLWDVSSSQEKPAKDRILAALCKNAKEWDKVGFVVFSDEAVSTAGLSLRGSNGITGDPVVDTSKTHYEIVGLSGKKLASLISAIITKGFETGIYRKKDLDSFLWKSVQDLEQLSKAGNSTRRGQATFIPPSGTQVVNPVLPEANVSAESGTTLTVPTSGTTLNSAAGENTTN